MKKTLVMILALSWFGCGKDGGGKDEGGEGVSNPNSDVATTENLQEKKITTLNQLTNVISQLDSNYRTNKNTSFEIQRSDSYMDQLIGSYDFSFNFTSYFNEDETNRDFHIGSGVLYNVTSASAERVRLASASTSNTFSTSGLTKLLNDNSENNDYKFDETYLSETSFCVGNKVKSGYIITHVYERKILRGAIQRNALRSYIVSLEVPLAANPIMLYDQISNKGTFLVTNPKREFISKINDEIVSSCQ